MLLNIILLVIALFILISGYKDTRKKQKGKNLFIIYVLLFLFWVLNIIDILIPNFLQLYQLIIYLISISLFMIILYKVLNKDGKGIILTENGFKFLDKYKAIVEFIDEFDL